MFKIVNGSMLKGTVKDADKKYFFDTNFRNSEEEYYQLLVDAQNFFEKIDMEGTVNQEGYFIYAPKSYKELSSVKYIEKERQSTKRCGIVDAKELFIDKVVKVKAVQDGYVFCGDDGRHRFIIAQKYNLNLLVDIIDL